MHKTKGRRDKGVATTVATKARQRRQRATKGRQRGTKGSGVFFLDLLSQPQYPD